MKIKLPHAHNTSNLYLALKSVALNSIIPVDPLSSGSSSSSYYYYPSPSFSMIGLETFSTSTICTL